jgi:hypothetical protein
MFLKTPLALPMPNCAADAVIWAEQQLVAIPGCRILQKFVNSICRLVYSQFSNESVMNQYFLLPHIGCEYRLRRASTCMLIAKKMTQESIPMAVQIKRLHIKHQAILSELLKNQMSK